MKDLIQEGRKIQEVFKNGVLSEEHVNPAAKETLKKTRQLMTTLKKSDYHFSEPTEKDGVDWSDEEFETKNPNKRGWHLQMHVYSQTKWVNVPLWWIADNWEDGDVWLRGTIKLPNSLIQR